VLAGASAIQVGTAIFNDPHAPTRVLDELQRALGDRGFDRFADAVGYAHRRDDEELAAASPVLEPQDVLADAGVGGAEG